MEISKLVLCCIVTSFAVHYGWRMRGTVIGGEKGAMLPGLLAGMFLALFSGGAIAGNFWLPAAAGLIGMSYGGIEPYGDTIAFIMSPKTVAPNPKKGYTGLAVKGALWFAVGGGFIGLSLSAMGGRYKPLDIILFPICTAISQFIGYIIFNQPYNRENGKYPKIYFAFESREEWGSNVGVLVTVFAFAAVRKDILTLSMAGCGLIFGAAGWVVAMKLYSATERPMKNGKYLLGIFSQKKLVSGWPNMEYCLGTFGGMGIALGFSLASKEVVTINNTISLNGLYHPFDIPEKAPIITVCVLFVLLLALNLGLSLYEQSGHKYSYFIWDCIERPLFNTLPFVLVLMCRVECARLLTAFMLIYVLCIKTHFDRLKKEQHRTLHTIIFGGMALAVFIASIILPAFPSPVWVILSGTFVYIASDIWWCVTAQRCGRKKFSKSLNSINFYWILLAVQSIIILICAYLLTR